jgi:hypothetical protein
MVFGLLNSILSFFGGLERLYTPVVRFRWLWHKSIHPSYLIWLTWLLQLLLLATHRCLVLKLNNSLQLFSIQWMMMLALPTGDDVAEEDDVSTLVPTNEPGPLDVSNTTSSYLWQTNKRILILNYNKLLWQYSTEFLKILDQRSASLMALATQWLISRFKQFQPQVQEISISLVDFYYPIHCTS